MSAITQQALKIIDSLDEASQISVLRFAEFLAAENNNDDEADPFYSEKNQAELKRRIADIESGNAKFVYKTIEELEAMAEE